MEESLKYLKEQFQLGDMDIRTYSPLTLAYIGDAIYDLIIRTLLVEQGNAQVNKLHKRASQLVKASAQSGMMEALLEVLTEEETAVYKRGRNAKSVTMAKNASMSDYRRATGFEALMGYLYLTEQWKRMLDLIKIGLEKGEQYGGKQIPGK
jgi:ribonuclease-3 family protein